MSSRSKLYADLIVSDPSCLVSDTVCTVPTGTELNKKGKVLLDKLQTADKYDVRPITHGMLMPLRRLKKFQGLTTVHPNDMCIVGGVTGSGPYCGNSTCVTSPIVLRHGDRFLTNSRSMYRLKNECTLEQLLQIFPQLALELVEE